MTGQRELFELPEKKGKEASSGALSRDETDVAFFVATQSLPVSAGKVAIDLSKTGLTNEAKRRFSALPTKETIQKLESRGWIQQHSGALMVRGEWRPRILGAAFRDPGYRPRAEAIAQFVLQSDATPFYHGYHDAPLRKQIRIELLLFLGRGDEALEILTPQSRFSSPFPASLAFLITEFDPDQLAEIPEKIQAQAVFSFLSTATFELAPVDKAWEALANLPAGPDLIALAGTVHFLRGEEAELRERIDELREMAETLKSINAEQKGRILADARSFEACLDFARGEIEEAIEGFEESLRIEKGGTRKIKFCPRWLGGLLFPLALCRRGGPADLQRARQISKWYAELETSAFSVYASFGDTIIDCVAGNTRSILNHASIQHRNFIRGTALNLNLLLFAIFYRLAGAKREHVEAWGKRMEELAEVASQRGYGWLAMEAGAFAASVNGNAGNLRRAAELVRDCGIENAVPFSDKLAAPESWEAQLKAMEIIAEKYGKKSATGSGAKKTGASRKELIWHLEVIATDHTGRRYRSPVSGDEDWEGPKRKNELESPTSLPDPGFEKMLYFDLTAVERSISKTGKPTKGRVVSLRKLKENSDSFTSLTDQDHEVARYISRQHDWGSRYFFSIDDPRVLLALAGHPLIFADAEATRPITLTRERIRVEVSEAPEDRIGVRLVPPLLPGEEKAKLVRVGPDNYRVYEIPKAVSELAEAFENRPVLNLPAKAKPRLMNAISTLAADLEISAEGAAGDAGDSAEFRQINGDPTPRLRLVPAGEGLRATLRVKPIATSDFAFSPGQGKTAIFGFQGEDRIQAQRDLGAETANAESVIVSCPALGRHRGESPDPWEWVFDSPLGALELLRDLRNFRESEPGEKATPPLVVEWPEGETLKLAGVVSAANTSVSLGSAADWLTLSGEVSVGEDLVFSMRKLLDLSAASTQRGFIEIGNGQFLALTDEFQRQIDDLRALSQPGRGETLKLPPIGALALESFIEEAATARGREKSQAKLWREWIDRFRDAREHRPDPPTELHAELRPYQLDGYRWLSRLARTGAGACLADDMGLGKTVQTLALLLERASLGPSLVVAPTSVAANWLDETVKFAPSLNPVVFGDTGDRAAQLAALGPRDLVICTYGLLLREAEALGGTDWNVIVLDEAQAIKNSATQRSKAARQLPGAFRVVTTGTPIENRLSELHTLFQFLLPGFLGSWEHFRRQFADPIERDRDADARAQLRRLIQPFLLRRLKSTVLRDLPERTEINLQVDLGEEERAFYEALRRRAVDALEQAADGKNKTGAIQILAELTRLRRACCHPVLVDRKAGAGMVSSKLSAFSETLDELLSGGHKVLVFSQFVDHLALVRAELEKKEIAYQYLDGSTSKPKRKRAVDAFQRGEGEVFLISLKAGGFGLNLTAADYVIHLDPWWNPAAEDQASDRAHRIGQTRPVTIYRLITRDTIEEKIVDLHHRKRELADSLLSDSANTEARLSPEELLALIRG